MISPINKPKANRESKVSESIQESSNYPVPSYAANIYLQGDKLTVGFPPTKGNIRGHTIILKAGETKSMLQSIDLAKKTLEKLAREAWDQDNESLAGTLEMQSGFLSKAYRQAAQFQTLVDILRHRYEENGQSKIGTKGAPVNAQILKGYREKMEENTQKRLLKEKMAALHKDPLEMLKHLMLLDDEQGNLEA